MKIIIAGGGQVDYYLASLLIRRRHKVTIIETKGNRIEVLKKSLLYDTILQGSGTEPKVLEAAGIRQADVVAAMTDSGESNLVVGTLAHLGCGVRRVIGRVNNLRNTWLFTPLMGVDAAVNQADLVARLVAEEISMGDMMTLSKPHGGKYSLIECIVSPGSSVQGRLLRDIELSTECVFVAIIRNSDLLIPRGEAMLQGGDKVVMTVHINQLGNMEKILGAGV